MIIIGVDFHPEFQQIAMVDTETGELQERLISKSRITDLRHGDQHSYVSARRLFWVISELQAVAHAGTAGGAFDSFPGADNPKVK
jgi:hypothetical protein